MFVGCNSPIVIGGFHFFISSQLGIYVIQCFENLLNGKAQFLSIRFLLFLYFVPHLTG